MRRRGAGERGADTVDLERIIRVGSVFSAIRLLGVPHVQDNSSLISFPPIKISTRNSRACSQVVCRDSAPLLSLPRGFSWPEYIKCTYMRIHALHPARLGVALHLCRAAIFVTRRGGRQARLQLLQQDLSVSLLSSAGCLHLLPERLMACDRPRLGRHSSPLCFISAQTKLSMQVTTEHRAPTRCSAARLVQSRPESISLQVLFKTRSPRR